MYSTDLIRLPLLVVFPRLPTPSEVAILVVAPSGVNAGTGGAVGNNCIGCDVSRPRSCADWMSACRDDSGSKAGIAGSFYNKRCNKSLAVFFTWLDKETSGNGI